MQFSSSFLDLILLNSNSIFYLLSCRSVVFHAASLSDQVFNHCIILSMNPWNLFFTHFLDFIQLLRYRLYFWTPPSSILVNDLRRPLFLRVGADVMMSQSWCLWSFLTHLEHIKSSQSSHIVSVGIELCFHIIMHLLVEFPTDYFLY